MADLRAVAEAMKSAIDTIPDLRAYTFTEQIQTPCALIEPNSVDFAEAMQRGHERWEFIVRVLMSSASQKAGSHTRFQFFGGVKDIKDALEAHVPLRDGTVAHDIFVRSAQNFGVWEIAGIVYLGGEFMVDVYA